MKRIIDDLRPQGLLTARPAEAMITAEYEGLVVERFLSSRNFAHVANLAVVFQHRKFLI